MKPSLLLLCLAATIMALPSCNSSKIAYGNSYYFKATPKSAVREVPPVNSVPFYAAVETATVETATVETATVENSTIEQPKVTNRIVKIAPPESPEVKQFKQETELTRLQKKEIRREKRAERKELKKELKQLVRTYKESAAPASSTAQQQMEGLIKAGVIVGAAGAVMLLVGVLVANGAFLTTLGGIFLAVGLVLVLIRLL